VTGVKKELRAPTAEELRAAGRVHNLELSESDLALFGEFARDTVASCQRLNTLEEPFPGGDVTERQSTSPDADRDPLNAIVSTCEVERTGAGVLSGYTVGLKDNIALAGIQMTCGWRGLEDYVPSYDATVVKRLLGAGATITGKLNMDALAFGGSGELSDFGPVRNPRDDDYLAGGSSGGAAAAVAAGVIDIALGTDAGGSIRRPAAWCGCVGLKPTFGLVPYTGIVSQAMTVDHVGPLGRSVLDCAQALDVIAGEDGLDPRQCDPHVTEYAAAARQAGADDISVALVEEGFGQNPDGKKVDKAVRDGLATFDAAGATVSDVSIPLHDDGAAIWTAINLEEMTAQVRNEGIGYSATGFVDSEWAQACAQARREHAADFPPTLKLALVTGEFLSNTYRGQVYAKARNLCRRLSGAYDETLADADVLAMPTIPELPYRVREGLSNAELIERAIGLLNNRATFNATGHPAISVPAGTVNGLPVGVSFVGRRGHDETVIRAASAFEDTVTE
jgi:amidase